MPIQIRIHLTHNIGESFMADNIGPYALSIAALAVAVAAIITSN